MLCTVYISDKLIHTAHLQLSGHCFIAQAKLHNMWLAYSPLYPHHTYARMSRYVPECKIRAIVMRGRNAFETIGIHSVGIRDTRAQSCCSPESFEHVQNYRGAFEGEPYRTAIEV